jgi:6,7-dimethyl-8-ribityllumazine synthase
MDLSIQEAVAIGNGILTTENDEQAWARARRGEGDKGGFAARAALTMIALKERFGADA